MGGQNTFILFFFFFYNFLYNLNIICLLWCSGPDRHSPVFSVQQFCALEDGSFVLAKRHRARWNSARYMQEWKARLGPRAHLHLLGFQFHLCRQRPASVWLIPLWSIWGRRHRYCWSPLCTAERSQILSVGIEESIDILPSGAITSTMNILILFSQRANCGTHSVGVVWVNWFSWCCKTTRLWAVKNNSVSAAPGLNTLTVDITRSIISHPPFKGHLWAL